MRKIFLILLFSLFFMAISVDRVFSITAPLDEWMPPINVDWICESGSIDASSVPNVDIVLQSVIIPSGY